MKIDHVVTSGTFSLDGQDFDVDNNIWIVGDDEVVIVVDAAHDAEPIAEAVGDRRLQAVVCTHGHNDHINAAVDLAERYDAPIVIHGDDRMLWDEIHPDREPDWYLTDGAVLEVADATLRVIHTPGHTPGGVCLYAEDAGILFTGDTLFEGGPGATGRSFSDRDTLVASIRDRLFAELPDDTDVHTGHGDSTTLGAEHDNVS